MKHEFPVPPHEFARIAAGSKTFFKTDNDRGIQPGDVVLLREFDDEPISSTPPKVPKGYTDAKPLEFEVGFIEGGSTVTFSLLKKATAAKKRKR